MHNWNTTFWLCLTLGWAGAHRFYTGHIGTGFAQLITGGGVLGWWIYDLVTIIKEDFRNAEGGLILKDGPGAKRKKRKKGQLLDPNEPPEMGSLEHRIQVCKAFLAMWQKYFDFFSESLENKKIEREEEKEFAQLTFQIAFEHFKFTSLMGGLFSESKKILNILDNCVSLSHLKGLPTASFMAMQVEWHEAFIGMNKTLGRLLIRLPPPEEPKPQKTKGAAAKPAAASASAAAAPAPQKMAPK
ncbi:MAG: TM2 domain-containing protein [Candidatus Sumerlaeota bacterium]|nr:TM2 domain-containing protein [Candidatus Sumerlaeota bacterium]